MMFLFDVQVTYYFQLSKIQTSNPSLFTYKEKIFYKVLPLGFVYGLNFKKDGGLTLKNKIKDTIKYF